MLSPRFALTALAPLLLSAPAIAGPKTDVQGCLVRPADPVDDNAKGTFRVRSQEKQGQTRDRIDVRLRRVDLQQTHDLWLHDGVDMAFVTSLEAGGPSSLKWSLDTQAGDVLPVGAASLDELVGRRIEIRVADDLVLEGVVPSLDASKKPVKSSLQLIGLEEGPAPEMRGRLRMRSKANKGQHRFVLRIRKADFASTTYHLVIEVAPGDFQDGGEIVQLGSSSKGRLRRDCHQGDPLPLDVFDLADLSGQPFEVRDGGGVTQMAGIIP